MRSILFSGLAVIVLAGCNPTVGPAPVAQPVAQPAVQPPPAQVEVGGPGGGVHVNDPAGGTQVDIGGGNGVRVRTPDSEVNVP